MLKDEWNITEQQMFSSYIQICHFLNWMNISKLLAANDYERTNIRSNYIIRQLCGAYKLW